MEVVRSGNTSKTVICDDCNATLKYTKVDISTYGTLTDHPRKEVRCPECGHSIIIN